MLLQSRGKCSERELKRELVGTNPKIIPGGRKCFLMMFLDFLQNFVGGTLHFLVENAFFLKEVILLPDPGLSIEEILVQY